MDWERWGRRLVLGGLAIVTGAFARMTCDAKVRQVGRRFDAGACAERGGRFACEVCGATVALARGDVVPDCAACGRASFTKVG